MAESLQSLGQLDLTTVLQSGRCFPSPTAWENQVFYFLMLDRLSDGQEQVDQDAAGQPGQNGIPPVYPETDRGNAVTIEADAAQWREVGSRHILNHTGNVFSHTGDRKRPCTGVVYPVAGFNDV